MLFQVVKELTSSSTDGILPAQPCDKTLANNFATKVRDNLDQAHHTLSVELLEDCHTSMNQFNSLSDDEVLQMIKSSSSSTSPLEPLPTPMTKRCSSTLQK